MKLKIYYNHWLPRRLGFAAITIYPYIFFADHAWHAYTLGLYHHEMIHIEQVRAVGWLRFYTSYLLEFIAHYIRLRDANAAYEAISYEIEAYSRESDPTPYCTWCGAGSKATSCECPTRAEND